MGKKISTSYVQQYSSKVSLLSQQTGKYGKSKVRSAKTKARKNTKKTSIGRRPKMSSMNKHKKRTWKKRNRGGE